MLSWFYSRACGVSPIHLIHKTCPVELNEKLMPETLWLCNLGWYDSSKEAYVLMRANDNNLNLPLSVRKKEIQETFKQQGVKVKFVKSIHNVK